MKSLALLIALFFMAIGSTVAVAPTMFVTAARYFITPLGLYVAAALRIAIGVALFFAAPESRTPRTLRIFGVVIFVGGLVTPLIGSERVNAIVDWYSLQGSGFIRLWASIAVLLGVFVAPSVPGA